MLLSWPKCKFHWDGPPVALLRKWRHPWWSGLSQNEAVLFWIASTIHLESLCWTGQATLWPPWKTGYQSGISQKLLVFHASRASLGRAVLPNQLPHHLWSEGHTLPAQWPFEWARVNLFWKNDGLDPSATTVTSEFQHIQASLADEVWSSFTHSTDAVPERKATFAEGKLSLDSSRSSKCGRWRTSSTRSRTHDGTLTARREFHWRLENVSDVYFEFLVWT